MSEKADPSNVLDALVLVLAKPFPRYGSLSFKELCERNPSVNEFEKDTVEVVGGVLNNLKARGENIYCSYARLDILEGLALLASKEPQKIIAENVLDPDEFVSSGARRFLLSAKHIYPGTLKTLFALGEAANEFVLTLIEKHESAGFDADGLVPELETLLLGMLCDGSQARRAALLVVLLLKRTREKVPERLCQKTVEHCVSVIDELLTHITDKENFARLAFGIASLNLLAARAAADISQMPIALNKVVVKGDDLENPMAENALEAVLGSDAHELIQMQKYQALLAMMKVKAREILSSLVAKEKIEAQKKAEEERRLAEKMAQMKKEEEQRELHWRQESEKARLELEQRLAQSAKEFFPHL